MHMDKLLMWFSLSIFNGKIMGTIMKWSKACLHSLSCNRIPANPSEWWALSSSCYQTHIHTKWICGYCISFKSSLCAWIDKRLFHKLSISLDAFPPAFNGAEYQHRNTHMNPNGNSIQANERILINYWIFVINFHGILWWPVYNKANL